MVCYFDTVLQTVFPWRGFCSHLKYRYSSEPYYKISKRRFYLHILITILMISSVASGLYYLPNLCHQTEQLNCMLMMSDQVFNLSGITFLVVLLSNAKEFLVEVKSWIYIYEYAKSNKFCILVSKRMQQLKIRRFIWFVSLLLMTIIFLIIDLIYSKTPLSWNFIRKLFTVYAFNLYGFGMYAGLQRIRLVGLIFERLQFYLQLVLIYKFAKRRRYNLLFVLQSFQNLTYSTYLSFRLLMKYFASILFCYIFSTLFSLILNIYICIQYVNIDWTILTVVYLRTLNGIIGIFIVVHNVEQQINRKVSLALNYCTR